MITTHDLTKTFRKVHAVSGLDWHVPEGSIYGLLGENGAGKSTTLRMLLGMVHPTRGSAQVAGLDGVRDSVAIRQMTAYIPDQKSIHGEMRVREFLTFYGGFFPEWSRDFAGRQLDKWQVPMQSKMKKLSKGMNAKVLLAAVFARQPQLVLLDEPTEGLDPASTEEVLSFLAGWAAGGDRTIVISSHRLEEIERITDHVAFLHNGRLALSGTLDDLRSSCKVVYVNDVASSVSVESVRQWQEVHSAERMGPSLRITTQRDPETVLARISALGIRGSEIHDLNLRDIYLAFCPR
jgi:ABC-2 type transport system ATP-binding protein